MRHVNRRPLPRQFNPFKYPFLIPVSFIRCRKSPPAHVHQWNKPSTCSRRRRNITCTLVLFIKSRPWMMRDRSAAYFKFTSSIKSMSCYQQSTTFILGLSLWAPAQVPRPSVPSSIPSPSLFHLWCPESPPAPVLQCQWSKLNTCSRCRRDTMSFLGRQLRPGRCNGRRCWLVSGPR